MPDTYHISHICQTHNVCTLSHAASYVRAPMCCSDLRWPSALLSDVVLRMLLGCDEALWPAAAPAAVCVMAVLEVRHAAHSTECVYGGKAQTIVFSR